MRVLIVSLKNKKTVGVRAERVFSHPLFGKTVKKYKNYQAALSPEISVEALSLGQEVEIVPAAPRSTRKHFLLVKVYGLPVARDFRG